MCPAEPNGADMGAHRVLARCAGSLLCAASLATANLVGAQSPPRPSPGPQAEQNAAILSPLVEIGRVRSRTPYCAALAAARLGVDAAITYQYAVPTVYRDLRGFRLDSHLTKHLSQQKTEHDLSALWDLATAGRAEIKALRTAAWADGVDEARRNEMLGFANALDGAKARQMELAKSIARTLAIVSELPVRDIANTAADDHAAAFFRATSRSASMRVADVVPTVQPYTSEQADALADHDRLQTLFGTFGAERFIRDDLQDAARHAANSMKLGGCNSL